MGEILKMSAFLVMVCMISALALSFTDAKTAPLIEEQKRKAEEKARKEVLPGAEKFEEVKEGIMRGLDGSGKVLGFVGKAKSKGFGGKLEVMAGIDLSGKVTGVKILPPHKETPGLGTNAIDTKGPVIQSLIGLGEENTKLAKDDPRGKVDAITGVTITSRAIAAAVELILKDVKDVLGK